MILKNWISRFKEWKWKLLISSLEHNIEMNKMMNGWDPRTFVICRWELACMFPNLEGRIISVKLYHVISFHSEFCLFRKPNALVSNIRSRLHLESCSWNRCLAWNIHSKASCLLGQFCWQSMLVMVMVM